MLTREPVQRSHTKAKALHRHRQRPASARVTARSSPSPRTEPALPRLRPVLDRTDATSASTTKTHGARRRLDRLWRQRSRANTSRTRMANCGCDPPRTTSTGSTPRRRLGARTTTSGSSPLRRTEPSSSRADMRRGGLFCKKRISHHPASRSLCRPLRASALVLRAVQVVHAPRALDRGTVRHRGFLWQAHARQERASTARVTRLPVTMSGIS